ncbi:Lrp/AsnC family transcriptional regulator [Nocardioides sp. zg-1308]|uniref:Lrp/AsnC family transcriptional regulator n=1 Tax=Nocardioides renjunii TaxID=3095075 RepID=A0ABU5K617_9ACTN|nr:MULTISPECIES: Lrp/AsnC family transcriptional regulator [unclassified Nocardioides]MDZ5660274.1 Lrp/AsnC family transcriptional regulator [Nocardioides sp. S-58]NPD03386.1 Lrp/AsnC family transcriptional regulator [Nocardioides sp. zg-1308]WQQ21284.1 Lrp/AsnC family transcriptional regulator [Nocardioides sp. S-34]
MDEIDGKVIEIFATEPRLGVLEASRRLGIARGTVQARLDKLSAAGVITGWGPDLSPEAIGYPVMAFLTLEIRQGAVGRAAGSPPDTGGHDAVARHLAAIPEVLEAYTITGAGDMWARVVARSNADLQRVIDLVLTEPAIDRSTTVIALATQIPYRVLPLATATAAPPTPPPA